MPDRIIRASILVSKSVDRLSADAERTCWRLLTIADDWGRMVADVGVLIARAYPKKIGRVSIEDMERWLGEIVAAGILVVYVVDEEPYAAFVNWAKHNKLRNKHSRFPGPGGSFDDPSNDPARCPVLEGVCQQLLTFADNRQQIGAPEDLSAIVDNRPQLPAVADGTQIEPKDDPNGLSANVDDCPQAGEPQDLQTVARNCPQLSSYPESESESESEVLINNQYLIGGGAAKNAGDGSEASTAVEGTGPLVSPSAGAPEPDLPPIDGRPDIAAMVERERRPDETKAQARQRIFQRIKQEKGGDDPSGMTAVGAKATEAVRG